MVGKGDLPLSKAKSYWVFSRNSSRFSSKVKREKDGLKSGYLRSISQSSKLWDNMKNPWAKRMCYLEVSYCNG